MQQYSHSPYHLIPQYFARWRSFGLGICCFVCRILPASEFIAKLVINTQIKIEDSVIVSFEIIIRHHFYVCLQTLWKRNSASARCMVRVKWYKICPCSNYVPSQVGIKQITVPMSESDRWNNITFGRNTQVPSVLLHCWLDFRKSIRPVKNSVMKCWCGYQPGARRRLFAYGPADTTASQNPITSCRI